GDGITDFDEVGGLPEQVTYTVDGKEYTSVLFLGSVNDKLSTDFIYVDGRVNVDGTINNEKMDYVPYSNTLKEEWYIKETDGTLFGTKRNCNGLANLHGLFADKESDVGVAWKAQYHTLNTLVSFVLLSTCSLGSIECFETYLIAQGGPEPGIGGEGTRKYINAMLMLKWGLHNSAYNNFEENMGKGIQAAQSVLNEYNTEIYIAMSPNVTWDGSFYHDTDEWWNLEYDYAALENLDAFGTFNKAKAGVTIHCTYDPESKTYAMDYNYYLMDLYDFPKDLWLWEANLLGICKSYELYGKVHGVSKWKEGQEYITIFKSLFN
ncbi:MAG: hypothetical protein K2O32_12260, partial [Acetatifactor sp.]|nr:hypothetical protein [Acetatifactor sp.]